MRYDRMAVIGRFQPFHAGHRHVVRHALEMAEHVVVLVGSANVARSVRNPFTREERRAMIQTVFPKEIESGRLLVRGLDDAVYNEAAWVAGVQREVGRAAHEVSPSGCMRRRGEGEASIALAVHDQAAASRYARMFPEWEIVEIPTSGTTGAADIRRAYLRAAPAVPRGCCPDEVAAFLDQFRATAEFNYLVEEAEWAEAYRKSWAAAPFPPVFVTVDCVVIQSGHVLLVRRGGQPGKGLLALPGGFLDPEELLRDAAVRELVEETQIADGNGPIPYAMLASFIEDRTTRVFDAPDRSIRGRAITHAFLFRCPDRPRLFRVEGGDDATSAAWYRVDEVDPCELHEDHWFILKEMTSMYL